MISIVLPYLKSTYISSVKPESNFIASYYLYAGTDSHGTGHNRILISFDLCLLPMDIIIESAILKMYADVSGDTSTEGCFTPYLITSCWEEDDVTWNVQPTVDQLIAGKSAQVAASEWYSWDITNIVEAWVNQKAENNGLLLKATEDKIGDLKRFHSSRGFYYKNFRPVLEVKYDFKNRFLLSSRNTVCNLFKYTAEDNVCFSSWQNSSVYSTYTFFVQNTGNYPANIYVQVSPDRSAIFEEQAMYNIAPGDTEAIVPQRFGFFTRLAYKSYVLGRKTSLMIWFQAQV